ncbi:MAG: ribosomal protein S18-alanine N-acetyltransferase [Alistipes sp.]|nr:ribosomal protein S18-alanine N-acetyltransferase [Alistipes sp.]
MIIRRMKPEDAPMAAVIEADNFSVPWSEKSFREAAVREGNIYVVAEEDGEILGYAGAWCVFGEADITNVCVRADSRKKGIATKMLRFLIEEGGHKEVTAFFLEVRESNLAAQALYEKFGFQKIGIRKNFYEKPVENGIVMSFLQ